MKKEYFLHDECMDMWLCIYCGAYARTVEKINHNPGCAYEEGLTDATDTERSK